jgi:hypothetical protein
MRSDDANHNAKFAGPFTPVDQSEKRVESNQRSSREALSPWPPKQPLSRPYSFTDSCFVLPDDTKTMRGTTLRDRCRTRRQQQDHRRAIVYVESRAYERFGDRVYLFVPKYMG